MGRVNLRCRGAPTDDFDDRADVVPGAIRDFGRDERGGITILMLLFFLLIILSTGLALDLAKHEVRRADLQSAIDRGALAAASLRQTLTNDPAGDDGVIEQMIESYVANRTFPDAGVTLHIDEDILVNQRDVYVAARRDVGTIFFKMVGTSELDLAVETRAFEVKPDLEVSMIFDTSGSMARDRITGNPDPGKLNNFKIAAGQFVDQILADNDEDRISVSLVQYDWHVNPGPWMFERVTGGTPDAGQGSCYEIDIVEDLENNPGRIPGLTALDPPRQIVDARSLRLEGWEPFYALEPAQWQGGTRSNICAPDDIGATIYLGKDPEAFFDVIGVEKVGGAITLGTGGIEADGSTTTYFGLQWGLALLNPETRPIIAEMTAPGVDIVDDAFASRPTDWLTDNTSKVIVLLTDGMMNVQADFYSPADATSPTGVPSQSDVTSAFGALCDWAKDPARDVKIFTVSYDTTEDADALMQSCASPGRAYRADRDNVSAVFGQIANEIEKLRLKL